MNHHQYSGLWKTVALQKQKHVHFKIQESEVNETTIVGLYLQCLWIMPSLTVNVWRALWNAYIQKRTCRYFQSSQKSHFFCSMETSASIIITHDLFFVDKKNFNWKCQMCKTTLYWIFKEKLNDIAYIIE